MKKSCLIACVLLGLVLASGAFAQNIKLAAGEWAPYTGEQLAGYGFTAEIVTAAAKAAGMTVEYAFYGDAWLRCENETKTGAVFATFPYTPTDERAKTFDFSEPIYKGKSQIFYVEGKGKDIAWTTLKDFAGNNFIGIAGYDYVPALKEYNIKMEPTSTTELAMKMLQAGRGVYLIEDEIVGLAAIKTVFGAEAGKVKMVTKPWKEARYCLMVSRTYPNSKEILEKFNAGLGTIKKNGTYKAILAKYGLSD